ncbi:MAG: ferritin family protein [Dehalococcoidia bacterium]|jgi:rubrerythrin|nr:ferritin family protein [Dehalococcoidia bacterium]MDP6783431.1 ferritin family protein [Dehalococcoidia bacterium]
MNGNTAAALSVLHEALLLEAEGRRFYLRTAEAVGDKTIRQTFAELAGHEETHLTIVQQRLRALSSGSGWTS